ncbi:UPF0602 protein C4orf47 homolog isoform X2 [Seriola lalandi dorsalis]|uniref:UPF0602 protein C4orf47 homolog isoform X2 n=1 Tax=Seriola lalandi dorsalis TaxID=1841481 RepID=UPI000C6F5C1F|nr:UPF0602 protein C4orf47 homolog isoform X2 [Seriola lalandi dorsalis]
MPSAEEKSDMERLGVFKEMSYISSGDKYTPPSSRPFNESAYRSRQMQAGVATQRCALQSGFFDKSFKRVFEREALSDPLRLAQQNRIQQAKKNLGKAFLPSNGVKKLCGSGSYYGTLSGPVEAMSPLTVTWKPHRSPGRNIISSPPKKGSGYSYPNITLSRLQLYVSEPYDRAREALKREAAIHRSRFRDGPFKLNLHPRDYFQAGGMKAGTFDSYPSHSADPFIIRRPKPTVKEPLFRPAPGPKTSPVKSIITVNVNRSVHSANYISTIPAAMTF